MPYQEGGYMGKTTKLTISLPTELVSFADKMAEERKISRSQVISESLREVVKKKKEEELKEGYLAMAEEHKRIANESWELAREVWPEWK
jgi:metal-responsive CopG/Arc/MetJ family transcriptional regulator